MAIALPVERGVGDLAEQSVRLILSLQDPSGAFPASPTFSAYEGYCWLRDGSFIADAMSAAGEFESAESFFAWCAAVVETQADVIGDLVGRKARGENFDVGAMPPTRFTLEGGIGTDDWWDFQTDGYGTWLWALSEHARRGGRVRPEWLDAVRLTAAFLVETWDVPCFDWWEEHNERRHVSTLGCVALGLERATAEGWLPQGEALRADAAAVSARRLVMSDGIHEGRLTKWLGGTAVDGSLSALVAMGFLDDDVRCAVRTVAAVREYLLVDGGVHRFTGDVFYGGGLWPLLTCFLGLAELRLGDRSALEARLGFVQSLVEADGSLPEQSDLHLLAPDHRPEWLGRWGPIASPLLWSHAMYVRLSVEGNRND
jgi:GH15 family glucan-1,4-alpha-glucosidase